MAITLDPCVRAILCGLSNATLNAIKGLINAQVAIVTAQIAIITAKLLKYDILATAAQAGANIVLGKIEEIRAAASLIPLTLIAGCLDLGNLNLSIQQTIDAFVADFEVFVADAIRLLSFIDELNLLKLAYQEVLDLYQAVLATISLCGGGGG